MIPVPRIISAGCGLAWAAPTEAKEELEALMAKVGIEREAIHECLL